MGGMRIRPLLSLPILLLSLAPARGDIPGMPVRVPTGPAAEAETDRWMQLVKEKADHGGWLVVRGSHKGDQAVAAVTLGLLSHAAVLDKEKGEVIEALAEGVQVTPVRKLLAQAHRLVIVRPQGWTAESGRAAVARARARVGQKYDWLGLVGAQQDARFYCTELAVDAYQGREKKWKLGRIIFPADVPGLGTVLVDTGPRGGGSLVEPRFARRLFDARGVSYAAEVAPGLYRGGQPDADGIAWLKSIGVKTIINLRHYHGDTEGQRVTAAGMRYERIPLESSDAPKRAQVARFMDLVNDPKLRPVYVHCLHGVDRTGTMMAVYRMEMEGWSNPEAFAEMEYFEAHDIWRDLRDFVRKYRPLGLRPAAAKK
jgi:tyrosine-protein phosphatase SIW14